MKKYLLKTFLLVLSVVPVLALILLIEYRAKDNLTPNSHMMNVPMCAGRLDSLNGPKIIFIGGSGCGFGIKSEIISDYFNMPVINTGTHAGIGLRLQLEMFKKYVSAGDIVVVVPEYSNFSKLFYLGNYEPPLQILNIYPQARKSCPFWQRLYLCQFVPRYFKVKKEWEKSEDFEDGPYCINALNEYGDITCYDKRSIPQKITVYGKLSGYNPFVRRFILKCERDIEGRGARFILLPPALSQSSFENNREFIDLLYSKFSAGDKNLFSASPESCSLPDSLYFDTPYHLTTRGIEVRSRLLIEQIEGNL